MNNIDKEMREFIDGRMAAYHANTLAYLQNIDLKKLIKRKDPYFYMSKGMSNPRELIDYQLKTALHESEESKFGLVLEDIAKFIIERRFGGIKSQLRGIDLEMTKSNITYLISVKSAPNWANKSQMDSMKRDFAQAKAIFAEAGKMAVCINGCCSGKEGKPDKGDYFKYCGRDFWQFISGEDDFYKREDLIIGLTSSANESSKKAFENAYSMILEDLVASFSDKYCHEDDSIDFYAILDANSGKKIEGKKIKRKTEENEDDDDFPTYTPTKKTDDAPLAAPRSPNNFRQLSEDEVFDAAKAFGKPFKNTELAKSAGFGNTKSLSKRLSALAKAGKLVKKGNTRAAIYTLAEQPEEKKMEPRKITPIAVNTARGYTTGFFSRPWGFKVSA